MCLIVGGTAGNDKKTQPFEGATTGQQAEKARPDHSAYDGKLHEGETTMNDARSLPLPS